MKRALLALVLFVLASCTTLRVIPASLNPPLLDFFAWAQTQARTETVLCLTGTVTNGVVRVEGMYAPRVSARSPIFAAYDGCSAPRTVGTWHPHIPAYPMCEFSDADRESFASSGLALDVLSCGKGEIRYLMRGDTTTHTLH